MPESSTQLQLRASRTALAHVRDRGEPGDRYEARTAALAGRARCSLSWWCDQKEIMKLNERQKDNERHEESIKEERKEDNRLIDL